MVKTNEAVIDEKKNGSDIDTAGQFVHITRIFNAPPQLVFKAWTDPKHLMNWFAPKDCTIHFSKIDVRPGGVFHSCIRNPNAHDCWCKGVYREIIVPERIVYSLAIADEEGNLVEPASVGMDPDWPAETIVTVLFAEHKGKTKLTLHQTVTESIARRTGAYPSWLEMFEHLAEHLAEVERRED